MSRRPKAEAPAPTLDECIAAARTAVRYPVRGRLAISQATLAHLLAWQAYTDGGWVPASDGAPPFGAPIDVWATRSAEPEAPSHRICDAFWDGGRYRLTALGGSPLAGWIVTHWRFPPEAPR